MKLRAQYHLGRSQRQFGTALALLSFAVLQQTLPAQIANSRFASGTKFKGLAVLLTAHGPQISGAAIAAQPMALTIINRSGIRTLHVSLTQNSALHSASPADVATELIGTDHADGSSDQTLMIELKPGLYYLTVREKLNWTVRLVVTP
jgi:hypothetical protein